MNLNPWTEIPGDPFVQAYLRRSTKNLGQGYGQPQVRSPHQVIGEQRTFAWMLRANEEKILQTHPERASRARISEVMLRAVPFLWLNDIDQTAAAMPIPNHVIAEDILPFDTCWWTYEGGHPMETPDGTRIGLADGFLIWRVGSLVSVSVIGQRGDFTATKPASTDPWGVAWVSSFRLGARWPEDVAESMRPTVGRVLACLAFLAAPFVVQSVERVPKKTTGRPLSTQGVHFVRLRAPVSMPHERREHGEGREWTVRWIVRGHLRAQWYPSLRSHKLIWIAPHSKGPEWAPLKAPAYAVVR